MDVWAPHAARVEVVLGGGERLPMEPVGEGWHELTRLLPPETDYCISLDGDEPLPDPRSPWQPSGIHGPSRTIDHAAFPWNDAGWRGVHLPSVVLYELHVGTFTSEGTFDAAAGKLDHLAELGVDAIEVMPVASFAGRWGWGYDGVALYAPHEGYGGPAGFKRLVDAAHRRGIGVVLDVVYNHLGPVGNHLGRFGPYFSDRHHTPWGAAVNLDGPDSGPVRRFFVDNAISWLRHYHLDGLRLDAVHALVDDSARHFLDELRADVDALAAHLGRPLWLVAESDRNDPRIVSTPDTGGYGLAAQWSDDFHHALHATLTGERDGYYCDYRGVADLATALRQPFVLDGRWSDFRRRHHGRATGALAGDHFVVCSQNHDQVGNRALGERTSHLLEPAQLAVAAALVLCSPYVPMLFQGEEWGATSPFQYFADFEDEELAQAVRDGRRAEFADFEWGDEEIPDPMSEATFERSKLDWDQPLREPHRELLSWYRALIALRRRRPDLTDARLERTAVEHDETGSWLTLHRGDTKLAVNFDRVAQAVPLFTPGEAGCRRPDRDELLLASSDGARLLRQGVVVPPHSVAVVGPREADSWCRS